MIDPTLRAAHEGEAETLTELAVRSKGHWGYDGDFLARARAELTVSAQDIREMQVLVAEVEGALAGFAAVDLRCDPGELVALFVDPAMIGRGLGQRLFDAALDAARAAGAPELLIESDPNAEAFYRLRGAVPVGVRRAASTGRSLPLLRIGL